MKILKRLTAFVLTAAICAGMFCVNVSADADNVSDEAVSILTTLNIITQNDVDDFKMKRKVTRGEFCIYLVRALNLSEASGETTIFTDLKGHELSKYIDTLSGMGIVAGYNNEFRPDDYITYNEAVKMAVSAAGYETMANWYGGYPMGYLRIADEAGITDGLKIADRNVLTKADSAAIIFNMLSAPLIEIESLSGTNVNFVTNSDENMLSRIFDIYKTDGSVEKTFFAVTGSDTTELESDEVIIDGEVYKIGITNADKLAGCYIEFYYRYDEDEEESTIIFITDKYENEILEINAEDIDGYRDGAYNYTVDGDDEKAKLSKDFTVAYNGYYPREGFTESMMIPKNGKITLVKSAKSSGYNAVFIEDYKNYVVNSADSQNDKIYADGVTFDIDDEDFKLVSEDKTKRAVSDVKADNIISVYYNADKSKATIYVSDEEFAGTISEIDRNGFITVTIDGEDYIAASDFTGEGLLSFNASVTLYLDHKGRIALVKASSKDGYSYAYILKAWIDDEDDGEVDVAAIKMFTQDSKIVKAKLAKNAKINGDSYKNNMSGAVMELSSLGAPVIKYKLNGKDEVSNLIVYDSGSERFIHKLAEGAYIWTTKQRSFGGVVNVKSDAIVFNVPADGDERDYKIGGVSSFSNDSAYGGISVYTNGDNIFGEVIVRAADAGSVERPSAAIVNINKLVDDDDEIAYDIELLYNGSKRTYRVDREETLGECKKGDVVMVGFDYNGRVSTLTRVYDCENDKMVLANPYEPQTGAGYRSRNRMSMGYVYIKQDGLMRFGIEKPTAENYKTATLENALLEGFRIYIIDRSSGKITVDIGSADDILDYNRSGGLASKVIVRTAWYDPEDIYIIK